uniref:Uncharacterized protein n=1 Tax=Arundo donax TaxID=35708 RepID=A0A0A9DWK8_ARUDO
MRTKMMKSMTVKKLQKILASLQHLLAQHTDCLLRQ